MAIIELVLENNVRAHLVGAFDDSKLDHDFSVLVNKQFFRSPAYRHGYDGRKHYYSIKTKSFPTGIYRDVRKWLKAAGHTVVLQDKREGKLAAGPIPERLGGDITLRDYQLEAVASALRFGRGIIHAATGCLSGDTVIECNRGGKSFKISLAALVHRFNGGEIRWNKTSQDSRSKSGAVRRMCWDPAIPTRVRFRDDDGSLRLGNLAEAYTSGIKRVYRVQCADGRQIKATASHRFLTQDGWKRLDELTLCDRLYVDAGKPGTSGVTAKKCHYRVVSHLWHHPYASRRAVRSGYSVPTHRLVMEAAINNLDFGDYVDRLRTGRGLSGLFFLPPRTVVHHRDKDPHNNDLSNLQMMPTNDHHSREHGVQGNWRHVTATAHLVKIVSIKRCGKEMTYDLAMASEPHNFLANGFVVHNSGKTELMAALIKAYQMPITLVLTSKSTLVQQTRERLAWRLGLDPYDIGIISQGAWLEGETGIYVALVTTLSQDKWKTRRRDLNHACQLLLVDEGHHAGAATWYKAAQHIQAYHRFGLTGTPTGRSDGKDMALRAVTGKVVAKVSAHRLVKRGLLAKPHVYFTDVKEPRIQFASSYTEVYAKGIVKNEQRNDLIVRYARELVAAKRRCWIFVKRIDHGKALEKRIPHSIFLAAQHASVTRQQSVVHRFTRGKVDVLILTNIFDEGVDTPEVDALIMAAGGKSLIETLQRLGRGMRPKEDNRLFVFDFYDDTHEYLSRHSETRRQTCEAAQYQTEMWPQPKKLAKVCA